MSIVMGEVAKGYSIQERDCALNPYKVHSQCLRYNELFVRLETAEANLRKIVPVSIDDGGDGVYTYLFDQERMLHTARVENQFEIATLHATLACNGGVTHVLAAGEMIKSGNNVRYNLISGTFMKPWMESVDKNAIQIQAQQLFEEAGLSATYDDTNKTFISGKNVPVTKEQLDRYVAAGIEVRLFKDQNTCFLEPVILKANISVFKERGPAFKDSLEKAEKQLEKSKEFIVYGARRKTRARVKKSSRRRSRTRRSKSSI